MKHIEKAVFIPAVAVIAGGTGFALVASDRAADVFGALRDGLAQWAGWFYVLAVGVFLGACLVIALSRWGEIKLGPQDSTPEYGFASWFAMLFSAGMGIGLMFYAVFEPVAHFQNPPMGEGGTAEAADQAMAITFFHWGIHAWAIYALVGLSLAYFSFRHGLPLTIRSALYPLVGRRIEGPIGHAVDTAAVVGTLFGVATSLGLGATQINSGLNAVFGVPVSPWVQAGLIAVITGMATISVVAGLDAGIKRLSLVNLWLAGGLLAFVFIAGPTLELLASFSQNIGIYLSELPRLTFFADARGETGAWMGDWTLFYWGWWISWSPFVGMFIARVSKGRTIREFIIGVLFAPTIFTFFWMTVYGNSALSAVIADAASPIASAADSVALFAFLETLPLAGITSVVAMVLVTTFFVTSSDSGSLVIDTIASGGRLDPPRWQRVFWAVLEGVVAAALLSVGGLLALQSAAIAAALPFTVVIILALAGLIKGLSLETAREAGGRSAVQVPISGAAVPWQTRVRLMFTTPTGREVAQFIEDTVRPSLEEVAETLRGHGAEVAVSGEHGRADLRVRHGNNPDFLYAVVRRRYDRAHFSTDFTEPVPEDEYARAEVALSEGGQHYDVFGYTKAQVIRDCVRQYERHLQWLHHITNA
jgi:choline/glycine/proline betaine transport protein